MKFPGLLSPIHDETLPSWLTRCALNPRILGISERNINEWDSLDFRRRFLSSGLGMEFDFDGSRGMELARSMQLDVGIIEKIFKPFPTLLLSPSSRVAYCHLCIQSDVSQKRYPSWRKTWCYVTHPYCSVHKCLLSFIDRCDAIEKQWNAYVQGDLGDYIPGRFASYHRRKPGMPPSNSRAWLSIRVQMWIGKLHGTKSCALPGAGVIVETSKIISAVDLIMRLLLIPRTERYSPGVAGWIFTDAYSTIVHKIERLDERLEYGAPNSVPYARMSALLLLGLIFRIFSPKEYSLLRNLALFSDFDIPDLKNLGKLIVRDIGDHEHEVLFNLLNSFDEISLFLREFIEGISWKLA